MQDGEGRREGCRKEKRQGGMQDKLYSGSISSFSDSRRSLRYQNRFRPEAEIHSDQVLLLLLAHAYRLRNRNSTEPNACDICIFKIDYNILEFPELTFYLRFWLVLRRDASDMCTVRRCPRPTSFKKILEIRS